MEQVTQMNTEERARLVDAGRMLNYFLEMDKKATESHIQLTPSERSATGIALCGIESVLAGAAAKAQAKVDQHKLDRKGIKCTDLALVLFDDKSKPVTQTDANGKLIQVERDFEPYKPPMGEDGEEAVDGIHPADGTQGKLSEAPAKNDPWKMPGKGNTPEVPENVKAGLIQALQDGAGRKKACETVGNALGIAFFTVEEHFDRLVKRGAIVKSGKNWIADPGDEVPAPDSTDPNVLATSETPGQGLVTVTEPADAQAA